MAKRTDSTTEAEVIRLYQQGMSTSKIAEQLGMWQPTAYNIVKRSGIEMRSTSEANARYLRDEHVFDEINTEDAAYWLGFIAADGTVRKEALKITLSGVDVGHLQKFAAWISPSRPVHEEQMKGRTKTICTIKIGSQYLVQQLASFGIMPNKTYIMKELPVLHQHPIMNDFLMKHWLRGYVDGDGYISSARNRNGTRNRIEITAYSKELLSEIQERFVQATGAGSVSILPNHDRAWRYVKCGKEVRRIVNYLYGDATIYLDRKYQLAMEILKTDEGYAL